MQKKLKAAVDSKNRAAGLKAISDVATVKGLFEKKDAELKVARTAEKKRDAAAQHTQVAAAANERIHEGQRALSAIYHALMVSIHDKYGLPFFTGYTPPANYVQSQPLVPPTDTSALVMEMSITD